MIPRPGAVRSLLLTNSTEQMQKQARAELQGESPQYAHFWKELLCSNIHRICHQYSEKPKRNSEKHWKGSKSASATKLGGPIEGKHFKLYLVTWLTSRVWSSKSLFGSRLSQMWFWLDRTATLLHTHREHSTSSTWNTACQHFTQQ